MGAGIGNLQERQGKLVKHVLILELLLQLLGDDDGIVLEFKEETALLHGHLVGIGDPGVGRNPASSILGSHLDLLDLFQDHLQEFQESILILLGLNDQTQYTVHFPCFLAGQRYQLSPVHFLLVRQAGEPPHYGLYFVHTPVAQTM